MRSVALALSIALAPLTVAGACASFEIVAPKSPRQVLADTNIAFIGVVTVAGTLYQTGIIPRDEAMRLAVKFVDWSAKLDEASRLLKVGETVAASKSLAEISAALSALALQLDTMQSSFAPSTAEPQPTAYAPPGAI